MDAQLPAPATLEESAALVVGGTAGIGLASARALVAGGVSRITIVGRDPDRGEAARRELEAMGAQAHFVQGDAVSPEDARRIVAEASAAMGSIEIAVSSTAPAVKPELFSNIPIDDIARTLTQVALPAMHVASAVLPLMVAQRRGVLLTFASDAGKTATPGECVIGAAKAAIIMFTRTIAIEYKRHGIRANVLTPSLVVGTITGDRVTEGGFSAKLFAKAAAQAQLGVSEAEDQAALVAFLAGPGAARLTGQAISVNGGISAA